MTHVRRRKIRSCSPRKRSSCETAGLGTENPLYWDQVMQEAGDPRSSCFFQAGEPTAMAALQLLEGCRVYAPISMTYPLRRAAMTTWIPKRSLLAGASVRRQPIWLPFLYRRNNGHRRWPTSISSWDDPPRLHLSFKTSFSSRRGRKARISNSKWRDEESRPNLRCPPTLEMARFACPWLASSPFSCQPEKALPPLIIVDGAGELGLHPYALNLIASLFKKASHHTQILIATQSSPFLDQFDPEDIIIVDREGQEVRDARPRRPCCGWSAWLDEGYSLGESLGEECDRRGVLADGAGSIMLEKGRPS